MRQNLSGSISQGNWPRKGAREPRTGAQGRRMIREPRVAHQIPAGDAALRKRRLDLRLTCRNNILGKESVWTLWGIKTAMPGEKQEEEGKIFMVTFIKDDRRQKEEPDLLLWK